jgi:hypothetical protein
MVACVMQTINQDIIHLLLHTYDKIIVACVMHIAVVTDHQLYASRRPMLQK